MELTSNSIGQAFNGVNYASMSQEGIPSKILQRSSPISPVVLGGEEALRPGYIELHGGFESPSCI